MNSLTGSGGLDLGTVAANGLSVTGLGIMQFTGQVTGSGFLRYSGAGFFAISGSSPTYTGTLTAANGTLF